MLVNDFAASGITYPHLGLDDRFWRRRADSRSDSSSIYYAFRRSGIDIPYPTQVYIKHREAAAQLSDPEASLAAVEIFSSLDRPVVVELARVARKNLHAAGETIVRQGESGSSMFIVMRGEAVVSLEPSGQEVARIHPGGFFGEMSLLTGAPRTATVRTVVDSDLMEITADTFRHFVLANPAVVEQVGIAVAARASEPRNIGPRTPRMRRRSKNRRPLSSACGDSWT